MNNIIKTEYSEEFDRLRQNRMLTSFHKYGPLKENCRLGMVDMIASLEKRIEAYKETGNTEFLVDAANFCMIEFMHPQHPQAHFRATSSEESPGIVGVTIKELMREG